VEYNETFLSLLNKFPAGSLQVDEQIQAYRATFRKEVEILDMIYRSRHTGDITAAVQERVTVVRGFVETVEGTARHFDPVVRAAARQVAEIIGHYGDVTRRNIVDASAAIADIVRELNLPDNLPLVQAAQLEPWLEGLSNANDTVITLVHARYDELADRPKTNMREIRAAVDKHVEIINTRLESVYYLSGSDGRGTDPNTSCINALTVLNEHHRNILAMEKGRRAAKRKNNPATPQTLP
jgi:hypothetical protein